MEVFYCPDNYPLCINKAQTHSIKWGIAPADPSLDITIMANVEFAAVMVRVAGHNRNADIDDRTRAMILY